MKSFSYIQGFLTTREAANYLNVTEHRVVELARNGDLDATRLSERVLLVNATSVHRLASIKRFAGRPLNPRAAWGELRAYKHVRCGSCRQKVRVPRGKGRLRVTCPKCGTKFEVRS